MYMHFKQTHVYAIRSTTRYITHSKYRNWSKCDVRRILNCDIYRIYFLNAMYVASACGVLRRETDTSDTDTDTALALASTGVEDGDEDEDEDGAACASITCPLP